MKSELFKSLKTKVTEKAYENYHSWVQSDVDIASQIRDGIRTVLTAFDDIPAKRSKRELLDQMKNKTNDVLSYYRSLPGDAGTWECSALNIIDREIDRLISES